MTDPFISFENEIWKPVVGYEDKYKVSNLGRVAVIYHEKILSPALMLGYPVVSVGSGKNRKTVKVHRLVMQAFVGTSKLMVDHKNGVRHDNRLLNLEYVTASENSRRGKGQKRENLYIETYVDASGRKRFYVQISVNKKTTTFGPYFSLEDAISARKSIMDEYNLEPISNIKNG